MDRDDAILDYLQDQMTPQERASFEQAMAQDASLAAEVSLMQSVRAELASGPPHEQADEVWRKLSATLDAPAQPANENRGPWRQLLQYAAACVLAVSLWQLAVVPRLGGADGGFRAASDASEAFVLAVKFVDTATLAQITDALAPFGGTITDGPSALGILRVSFADAQQQSAAQEGLGNRPDLVEFLSEP